MPRIDEFDLADRLDEIHDFLLDSVSEPSADRLRKAIRTAATDLNEVLNRLVGDEEEG